jgi:hypothetical protein
MNTPASNSGEIRSYVQLQHQIHDALREQHPEWIEQNGDCPTCESYESRFAELLNLFQSNERKSAARADIPHRLARSGLALSGAPVGSPLRRYLYI